jgi:hypothetical protein
VQRRVANGERREGVTIIAKEDAMRSKHSARESGIESRGREATRRLIALGCAVAAAIAFASAPADAGEARGTITYKSKAGAILVTIRHAYLVKGPDVVSGKTIRRVVLSVADIAAKLSACGTMLCSDGDITEGMTIDFDAEPRLNYWFVGNNQLVQYSGTAEPASLKLTADTPQRLAGTWDFDESAAGGPRVQIEFDAPLVKEVTKLR